MLRLAGALLLQFLKTSKSRLMRLVLKCLLILISKESLTSLDFLKEVFLLDTSLKDAQLRGKFATWLLLEALIWEYLQLPIALKECSVK